MASSGMPAHQPYPGASFFMNGFRPAIGKRSRTAMGQRLVAVGCGQLEEGPGPVLTLAHVKSYEVFAQQLGATGLAATWPPGRSSWDCLKVPKV